MKYRIIPFFFFVLSFTSLAQTTGPIDIPRLEGITIDGHGADWSTNGFSVGILAEETGRILPAEDLNASFRLGWNTDGLLVLINVNDNTNVEFEKDEELWQRDSIELFLATKTGSADMVQTILAPGLQSPFTELRYHLYDHRQTESLKAIPPAIEAVRTIQGTGYTLEVLLPWKNLGLQPAEGLTAGFQLYVNDSDGGWRKISLKWYPKKDTHIDTTAMYPVRLSDRAGPPENLLARVDYDRFLKTVVRVRGSIDLIGKSIRLVGPTETALEDLLEEKNGRAYAEFVLPLPKQGQAYPDGLVQAEHQPPLVVHFPHIDAERKAVLLFEPVVARPFVFTGPDFPPCDFKDPLKAELLLGPYRVETTYYDEAYNVVTTAAQSGRYGAVVKIIPEDGRPTLRMLTLYCSPTAADDFDWHRVDTEAKLNVPDFFGFDPHVSTLHPADLSQYLQGLFADSLVENAGSAELFSCFHDLQNASNPDAVLDYWTQGRQWWVGLKRKLAGLDTVFTTPLDRPMARATAAPILRVGTSKEAGMSPEAEKTIDTICTEWAANSDEAFAVCIARHGVVFFHRAYGNRFGQPMTVDTQSSMASITKLLCSTLLMEFVDQGLVNLDDPVDRYLPPFADIPVATPLKVRHLFTHTAAFDGHWGDYMHDLEWKLADYYPFLEIGRRYQYNGVGFALGGKIMEALTGEAMPVLYRKHLLGPLGCTNTTVNGTSWDARSVPMDIARIGQLLLNRGSYDKTDFFSPKTFTQMLPRNLEYLIGPTGTEYGLGTSFFREHGLSDQTFGHGAASAATLRIDPVNDLVIVMCRNEAGTNFDQYHPRFIRAVVEGIAK